MTSPATNWLPVTINGKSYLQIDTARFLVPLDWDPSSCFFLAVAAPDGGMGNFEPFAKGDDGVTPTIDTAINFDALEPDDTTPDSATWSVLAPNVYQLNLALHKGQKGLDGGTTLDPTDYGTPVAGQMLVVNADGSDFILMTQKVGDRYVPTVIHNVPSGNDKYTVATVAAGPFPWDWRPSVDGACIITPGGTNVSVDLIARLNDESGGNDIGRSFGAAGPLVSMPPPNSADGWDRVAAGAVGTVYLRTERQTGTDYYTTAAATTRFGMRVHPIP